MLATIAAVRRWLTCSGCGLRVNTGALGVPKTWSCTECGTWNTVQ